MMEVSISKTGQGKVYTYGFTVKELTLQELASIANRYSISGSAYEDGHRRSSNVVKGSNMILIDCDEPGQAEDVEKKLQHYDYVKVPSASNLKSPYKWHYFIPTQEPLSVYSGAYRFQVQQFFNQVGITDEMIDVTGSYDIARQFAPAMFEGADDLVEINDTSLNVPVVESPKELCNEAVQSITLDIEGLAVQELPSGHLWYQGRAITYAEVVKALTGTDNVVVSGFGCPHNNSHSLDNRRGYGFGYLQDGEVVIKCSGNACKDDPYFVVPYVQEDDTIEARPTRDKPVDPDEFAELMRQRLLGLNKEFYVSEKMMDAFFQYGAIYNEVVNANQNDTAMRYVVPASTGSGKTVSVKLYMAEISKLGLSGLLVVSEVATAREAVNEINELAGCNIAGYYASEDNGEEFRFELDELPEIAVITHSLFIQRSDSGKDIDLIRKYQGNQRDLVAIDERIDLIKLVSFGTDEIPELTAILRRDNKLEWIAGRLDRFNDIVFKHLANATAKYSDVFEEIHQGLYEQVVSLVYDLDAGMYNISPRIRKRKNDSENERRTVINLLDRLAFVIDSRHAYTKEGNNTVLHRSVDLSGAFGSVAILDATANVNPLYDFVAGNRKDTVRMKRVDTRTYEPVQLHICNHTGLTQSKTGLYTEPKKLNEIVDLYLKLIGDALVMANDKMLVVTYKDLVPLFKERSPYDNVKFIHWGSSAARGSNEYSDFNKAMAIGWFRRPLHYYTGSILSIVDYDAYRATTGSVMGDANHLQNMLIIDDIIQFFNRIRCRVPVGEDGGCAITDLYMFTGRSKQIPILIEQSIGKEMPGIQFKEWKPTDVKLPQKKLQTITRIENVVEWMLSKNGEYDYIGATTIAEQFGLTKSQTDKMTRNPYFVSYTEELGIVKVKDGRKVLFKLPEGADYTAFLNNQMRLPELKIGVEFESAKSS